MSQDETAYEALRQQLLTGDLRADEKLAEIPWSERLGVGRAAVRAALRRLAGEGLVVKVRASYRVPALEAPDVRALRQLREILEVGALRAAGTPTSAALRQIRKACEDYERFVTGGYLAGAREADLRFHQALVSAAGNARLLRAYQQANLPLFQNRIGPGGRMLEDYSQAQAEHRVILDHLAAGDTEAAITALEAHLRRGENEITAPPGR